MIINKNEIDRMLKEQLIQFTQELKCNQYFTKS